MIYWIFNWKDKNLNLLINMTLNLASHFYYTLEKNIA